MATIRAFSFGSMATDDVTEVEMACIPAQCTVGNYGTLENPVGTDYQVAAGKTFYITMIHIDPTVNHVIHLGYGDDGVAADSAAAPTNWVVLGFFAPPGSGASPNISTLVKIPAQKYPCVRCASGANNLDIFNVYGYEI